MGLPLWKPRDIEQEKRQEVIDLEDEDAWTIFPQQLASNVYIRRSSSRQFVNSSNNHNSSSNPRHLAPISSIPLASNSSSSSSSLRRSRIARRHSMLTSSLIDRRRSSRVHHLPGASTSSASSPSSSSPPVRSELDRRLQQRINEKEDLLEQLQVTVSLLDQFLSARSALGSDIMNIPAFITEVDLPAVLESAASLAAIAPSVLSSSPSTNSSQQHNNISEVTTLHEMIDRLLQIPPYSTRIHNVESNIISAHRRIREQLGLLGNPNIPPIIRPSSPTSTLQVAQQQQQAFENRSGFMSFLGS